MKKGLRFLLFVLLAVVCAGCSLGEEKPKEPEASTTMVDTDKYFGVSDNSALIIIDGVKQELKAEKIDGQWYLPMSAVDEIDARFYVNEAEETVIYTDAEKSIKYFLGLTNAQDELQGEIKLDFKAFVWSGGDGKKYELALDLVKDKALVNVYEKPNRIVIHTKSSELSGFETVSSDLALRTAGTDKNDIIARLKAGTFLSYAGDSNTEYIRVMTEDGLLGYVKSAELKDAKKKVEVSVNGPEYKHFSLGDGFKTVVWQNMIYEADSSILTAELSGDEGVDVVIPTWFRVKDLEGNVSSNANKSYVDAAHGMGLKVLGLVDDFEPGVKGYDVYSNSVARRNIVDSLVRYAIEYGLDGLNIDFEYITVESAPHYLQLLRELYIETRKNNLLLTICDYVPNSGNAFYDLETQEKLADYVMVMTYDEHYNASDIGSVASKEFVAQGVSDMLEFIPKERLFMGVPFYTRAWAEGKPDVEGNPTYEMIVLTMKGVLNEINARGATVEWNDTCGQNIATYLDNDKRTVLVWVEDAKSIQVKRDLANQFGVAGVACWALGQQDDAVWDILK